MPIYGYKCGKCNHSFDSFRKVDGRTAPESEPCPNCNEVGEVKMKFGAPTILFSADRKNTDGAWKERLQKIHEANPGSKLDQASTLTPI